MNRTFLLLSVAALSVAGCASEKNAPYKPASEPEKIEYGKDSLDVYPNDVRSDPSKYDGQAVAWVGVIQKSDAEDTADGYTRIHTTFEHHYFDWEQDKGHEGLKLVPSPRGEGLFKTTWTVVKANDDISTDAVQKYVGAGKLAIVYGTPVGVDADGTIILKYRYLRLIGPRHFTTTDYDYGRLGEPVTYLHSGAGAK